MDDRFLVGNYADRAADEGVADRRGFGSDLRSADVEPWARVGDRAKGAIAHLDGRGDWFTPYILEPAADASAYRQHHRYKGVFHVRSGRGSTEVGARGGKHGFERGEGSLFALPANAWP
ncbi:hypothetical protein [Streptomyces sp. NPDC004726]